MRVGSRDIALQVLQDLILIEGQHGEYQIVLTADALPILSREEGEFFSDGTEILAPASEHESDVGVVFRGSKGEGLKQSARESLSCALFQVDENLIQAVEYDKAPLGGDDFKCAIHIDWGR